MLAFLFGSSTHEQSNVWTYWLSSTSLVDWSCNKSEDAEFGEYSYIFQHSITYLWPFIRMVGSRMDITCLSIFGPILNVTYDAKGCRAHELHCTATHCKGKWIVRRFLDITDRKSTSNLKRHATTCRSLEIVKDALDVEPFLDHNFWIIDWLTLLHRFSNKLLFFSLEKLQTFRK